MRSAKQKAPMLSAEEEVRLQAEIARNPESREPTEEQLAKARPASEVLPPALYSALTKRGRPKAEETKLPVKLRLDRATVEIFRSTGPGWQTRMNDVLGRAARRLSR